MENKNTKRELTDLELKLLSTYETATGGNEDSFRPSCPSTINTTMNCKSDKDKGNCAAAGIS